MQNQQLSCNQTEQGNQHFSVDSSSSAFRPVKSLSQPTLQNHSVSKVGSAVSQDQGDPRRQFALSKDLKKQRSFTEAKQQWKEWTGRDPTTRELQALQLFKECGFMSIEKLKAHFQRYALHKQNEVPKTIPKPAPVLEVGNILKKRQTFFKSPYRLQQKLQGIQEARKQQLDLATSESNPQLNDSCSVNDGSRIPASHDSKRRHLNSHSSYIEYLIENSEKIQEAEEKNVSDNEANIRENKSPENSSPEQILFKQVTPKFGVEEDVCGNRVASALQAQTETLHDGSSQEEEKASYPSEQHQLGHVQFQQQVSFAVEGDPFQADDIESWNQPDDVAVSIPDSFHSSVSQSQRSASDDCSHDSDEQKLNEEIEKLRKSHQAFSVNSQNHSFAEGMDSCQHQDVSLQAPQINSTSFITSNNLILTAQLMSTLTSQYFREYLTYQYPPSTQCPE